jgi:hypothetical protein
MACNNKDTANSKNPPSREPDTVLPVVKQNHENDALEAAELKFYPVYLCFSCAQRIPPATSILPVSSHVTNFAVKNTL